MALINNALQSNSIDEPVFYVDEADIDLNHKIGADWMRRHQQKRIPTHSTKSLLFSMSIEFEIRNLPIL